MELHRTEEQKVIPLSILIRLLAEGHTLKEITKILSPAPSEEKLRNLLANLALRLREEERLTSTGKRLNVFIDGASRGNPGESGIGIIIEDEEGNVKIEISEYVGVTTNNVAEYKALIRALERASQLGGSTLYIHSDSELLTRQLQGEYRVRNHKLHPLYLRAKELIKIFPEWRIILIGRRENKRADRLANLGIDKRGKSC